MCEKRNAIAAVNSAAEQLLMACAMHNATVVEDGGPDGVSAALRKSFVMPLLSPNDMLKLLRRVK